MRGAVFGLAVWLCAHVATKATAAEPPSIDLALLAIELNGQQVSRGALVHAAPDLCLVQVEALEGHLAPAAVPMVTHEGESFFRLPAPAVCARDEARGQLQVNLPSAWIRPQTLRLSNIRPADPLPLLLGTKSAESPAPIMNLTAAHLDIVADRYRQQWAVGASHRGLQLLMTDSPQDQQPARATLDWLWPSGAALRIGDQVTREGPEQRPRSLRGLSLTSRLQVLRPQGSGQGQVALDAPARLQFFDTQGQPLFSTGLLPAGRYRLEGLGAPTLPGLLTVRVEGLSGQTETLLLPWVASPLLLAEGATHWDLWIGKPSEDTANIGAGPGKEAALHLEGLWARGMSLHETLRTGWATTTHETLQGFVGMASQRWPQRLASADLGFFCMAAHCAALGGLELSAQPRRGLQWSAGLRHEAGLGQTVRLSASQRLTQSTTVTAHLSEARTRLQLLSLQTRLSPEASLQASLRVGSPSRDRPPETSFFLSLHLSLPHRSA
ncbi:MAG: hypothetical protein ACO24G_01135, partial [Burkholderiaceae bacterium]